MKIILSPTKTMCREAHAVSAQTLPIFLSKSRELLSVMKNLSLNELKTLWKCSDAIALQNQQRFADMDFQTNLSPALFSYEGLAFQHIFPASLNSIQLDYLQRHLRILSGFYGVLKPLDGIQPYRLDMQDKINVSGGLYAFWGKALYDAVHDPDGIIVNLASKEYAKCIEKYLTPADTCITCEFVEIIENKLIQKATFSKMARGEMVRYLAEHQIEDPVQMKDFKGLDFHFRPDLSTQTKYIFERKSL